MSSSVPPITSLLATIPSRTGTTAPEAASRSSWSPACAPLSAAPVCPITTWPLPRIAATSRLMTRPTASVGTALVASPHR